jgi:hypothetical protein
MGNLARRAIGLFAAALAISLIPAGATEANVTYTYDSFGRLASATYDSGLTVYYFYDLNTGTVTEVVQAQSGVDDWGGFNWGAANWVQPK